MLQRLRTPALCLLSVILGLPAPAAAPRSHGNHRASASHHAQQDDHKPIAPQDIHNPVLWSDPGDIRSRNLFFGSGGPDGMPHAPFKFLDVDKHDSNPKFDVEDSDGRKWRVKLGAEARPEVVASRLLWAVGYFTEDDYVLQEATIPGLHLRHTAHSVRHHTEVLNARFARKPRGEKRIAAWRWKSNPFSGTREFNGLRVMMAVLNSWDLKDENNAVYSGNKDDRQLFLVSDVGATFGANSVRIRNANGKGNVKQYAHSKFITHLTPNTVSFGTPGPATTVLLESAGTAFPLYIRRERYLWIGRDIPRADARWIGSLLGQLSHEQLADAFRAGRFTPGEISLYLDVLEGRIAQLKAL